MVDQLMRATWRWAAAALLCALPLRIHAATTSPSDQCWKQHYEGDIRTCVGNMEKRTQAEMEVALAQALGRQENMDPPAVRASQDAFLRYRDAECGVEGDTMRGGTNDADQAAECIIDKNTARAAELRGDVALTFQ